MREWGKVVIVPALVHFLGNQMSAESSNKQRFVLAKNHPLPRLSLSAIAALGLALAAGNIARADHGPGTSGGGASTQSGETLKPGKFAVELREDYTEFEHLSRTEIEAKAVRAGGFDYLDRSFLRTAGISYGVVENFPVGLTLGYYHAVNSGEAEFDPGTGKTELLHFDPDGLTDLWLSGKY